VAIYSGWSAAQKGDDVTGSLVHRKLPKILTARSGGSQQDLEIPHSSLQGGYAAWLSSARENHIDLIAIHLAG